MIFTIVPEFLLSFSWLTAFYALIIKSLKFVWEELVKIHGVRRPTVKAKSKSNTFLKVLYFPETNAYSLYGRWMFTCMPLEENFCFCSFVSSCCHYWWFWSISFSSLASYFRGTFKSSMKEPNPSDFICSH